VRESKKKSKVKGQKSKVKSDRVSGCAAVLDARQHAGPEAQSKVRSHPLTFDF
jgi:hypothetical protein